MIIKKTLSDQIYDNLKRGILTKKIPLGSKIVNKNLQMEFGVSSSPIRDAINRLYQDGLIAYIDNTGATVIDLEYKNASEINELLKYIVCTGVKISFEKANRQKVVKHLRKMIEFQTKYIDDDKYYDYDYEFHKTFIDYSDNSRLKKLYKEYNSLNELLVRAIHIQLGSFMRERNIEMHKNMVDEYEAGNLERVIKLTEEHYNMAEAFFKDMLPKES